MSKPQPQRSHRPSSSSLNPWDALFASVTRPRTVPVPALPVAIATDNNNDDENTATATTLSSSSLAAAPGAGAGGGYTILIQHSMTCSSQRQWAVASCVGAGASAVTAAAGRAAMASVVSPWKDSMSGPMVVRQAFEELCSRCNGAVVFVSLLGDGGGVLDMEELDESDGYGIADDEDDGYQHDDDEDDEMCQRMNNLHLSSKRKRRTPVLRKFRKSGAYVDLSSNPFGWDDEDTDNKLSIDDGEDSFVHRSMIHQLPSIVRTIQKAVASIEHRRRRRHRLHNAATTTTTTTTVKQQQTQQQPIPIVFDSLSPLLQYHGVENFILMLKCLRRVAVSTPTTIPTDGGTSSSSYPSILSPIVAPVLYESMRPSEHRSLEDVADAFIHLKLMDKSKDHASPSTTTSQSSTTLVIPGNIDLVRRGGGGGGGSGGKLMRHCVPVRILRSSMESTNLNNRLKENWHWKILDHDGSHGTDVAVAKEDTMQTKPSANAKPNSLTNTSTTTSSRPRIYLQDDDPDDELYDEEADYDYG